jgi:hypothetical protein
MVKKTRLLTRPTLACRDAPCPKQGRSEGLPTPYTSLQGSGHGGPLLRASNEHSFTVRVLRAKRAPGRSPPFFSILLGLCCEMGIEPIADRCGHLVKILFASELVIGAWQKIQPLRTSERVTQSQALMEGDTFILLTLDN